MNGLIFVGFQFSWRVQSRNSKTHEIKIFCISYEGKYYGHKFWTPQMHHFSSIQEIGYQRKLENWHSQRGPRCGACHYDLDLWCHYDLDLWPFDPKIYRCLPFFILHLCMKYEVCRSNTVRVIALQRSVDRRTDGQTDKVITIGLPHLRWRGPNKAIHSKQQFGWYAVMVRNLWTGGKNLSKNTDKTATALLYPLCNVLQAEAWTENHFMYISQPVYKNVTYTNNYLV